MIDRICISPDVCHGKPAIRGTRVLVANILGSLGSGEPVEEVLADYPGLTREDIFAALQFGGELSRFEVVAPEPALA